MLLSQQPNLYIAHHPQKGRCVHTATDIAKGAVIEVCNAIVLSVEDTKLIHQTKLYDYYFAWDDDIDTSAILLGFGSLYNHSKDANAEVHRMMDRKEMKFVAIKDIPAGAEITIDYQGDPLDSECDIWFEVVD